MGFSLRRNTLTFLESSILLVLMGRRTLSEHFPALFLYPFGSIQCFCSVLTKPLHWPSGERAFFSCTIPKAYDPKKQHFTRVVFVPTLLRCCTLGSTARLSQSQARLVPLPYIEIEEFRPFGVEVEDFGGEGNLFCFKNFPRQNDSMKRAATR